MAGPIIGHLPVDQIDTALIMRCIEPIWATKTETASRLDGRIESVLDWARYCSKPAVPAKVISIRRSTV